jgi:uncharacterized protein (DUF2236 family)
MWDVTSRRLGRVLVVAGAVSTTGMFDEKSELVLDEQVVSVENALTVRTSELGHLRYGDAITVDSIAYRVRHEPMRMADGLLCVVSLERAMPSLDIGVFESGVYQPGVFV